MSTYYIKNIWGPGGQNGYPQKDQIEFAQGQEGAARRFSKCDGFLLYETGHCECNKIGAKSIYARGIIALPEIFSNGDTKEYGESIGANRRKFPYSVKINLSKRANSLDGVPLDKIRKIIKKPKETMQRPGGLVKITKEQFDTFCLELEKSIKSQNYESRRD